MVRILSAALLLAAVSASAAIEIPSFELSVANVHAALAASRAERVKLKAGNLGPQINNLAWQLDSSERDLSRLRNDLNWLLQRMRRYQQPQPGRPGQPSDPSLRWDVERFTRDLAQLTRDAQWRLMDLRNLSAQAEKDEALVAPASRLADAARRLKSESNWFSSDARFAGFDFRRAGFNFEAMDVDRDSRDLDWRAQDLQSGADQLLAKVKPLLP